MLSHQNRLANSSVAEIRELRELGHERLADRYVIRPFRSLALEQVETHQLEKALARPILIRHVEEFRIAAREIYIVAGRTFEWKSVSNFGAFNFRVGA